MFEQHKARVKAKVMVRGEGLVLSCLVLSRLLSSCLVLVLVSSRLVFSCDCLVRIRVWVRVRVKVR